MIGTLVGPYRIEKKLGQGGMGAVYEAVHETIERRVAIKVLNPQLAQNSDVAVRFINEARAVNLVNHPGLVQVSDFGQMPDGTAYIVMELLEGETLSKRLARLGGKMPLPEILKLVRQITSALQAAHLKGIVHRDLKPDNVMLVTESDPESGTRERVKLLDFGIAKLGGASQGVNKSNTQTDAVLGSPEYMSPEQCKGGVNIDQKADLYSLGVIMFRLLSGRLPFNAEGVGALMAMHIYEKVPDLKPLAPDAPPELVALIEKMLSKASEDRPTAAQVQYEIEQIASRVGMPMVTNSMQAIRSQIMTADSMPDSVRGISTLGGASGQAAVVPVKKSRAPLFIGLGVGSALLIVGAVSMLALRNPQKPQPQVVVPPPPKEVVTTVNTPPPPPKQKPKWSVDSEPQGADIIRTDDGQLLGQTPWTGEQPEGSSPVEVVLHLSGYADRKITLKPGADSAYKQALKPKRGKKSKADRKNQDHKKDDGPEIAD